MRVIVGSDQWAVVFPSFTHFAKDRWKSCTLMSTKPRALHRNKNFGDGWGGCCISHSERADQLLRDDSLTVHGAGKRRSPVMCCGSNEQGGQ